MKKIILGLVILALLVCGYFYFNNENDMNHNMKDMETLEVKSEDKNTITATTSSVTSSVTATGVKEFNMNSWMEIKDGKMGAFFSLKEIKVKKGDKVKININNTKGTHDFVIDQFGIKKDTPEGSVTVIEFTADKAGSFEYYCSKYSHRTMGQTGTLIVE